MKKKAGAMAGCVMLAMVGCASIDGYTPVIDSHNSPKTATEYTSDLNECRTLAKQRASQNESGLKSAGVGAVLGAATGAVLGAISGDAGIGAAVGAGLGGLFGGVEGLSNEQQKQIVVNCMAARGYVVLSK